MFNLTYTYILQGKENRILVLFESVENRNDNFFDVLERNVRNVSVFREILGFFFLNLIKKH